VEAELGLLDCLGRLACDVDLRRVAALGWLWTIAECRREGGRKVDGRVGRRFDDLDVLPIAAAHELVEREFDRLAVDNSSKLGNC
jgi:hypothetical protein